MDVAREQCPRWKSSEDHGPHFWSHNADGPAPLRCGGWGTGHSDERCGNKLHHEAHVWSEYNHPGEEGPHYCPGQDAISEVIGSGFITLMGDDPYAPQRERTHVPISWGPPRNDPVAAEAFGRGEGWGEVRYGDGRDDPHEPVGLEDALQKRWTEEMDHSHDLFRKFGIFVIAVLQKHPDMVDRLKEIEPDPLELRQLVTFNLDVLDDEDD